MLPFTENGSVHVGCATVDAAVIAEALADNCQVRILDEEDGYLKLQLGRMHATRAVFPFPQPRMELWMEPGLGRCSYRIHWPDYWVPLAAVLLFWLTGIPDKAVVLPLIFVVISATIWLDNRRTSKKIRGALEGLRERS